MFTDSKKPAMQNDVGLAMVKAKIALLQKSPFFATLVMRLPISERQDVGTMATDGKNIFFNAQWVATLSQNEIAGVLAHESLHVAFAHAPRKRGKNPKKWNIAGDHAINLILRENGFSLPAGGLCDSRFAGMNAEKIYELLPDMENDDSEELLDSGQSDAQATETLGKTLLAQAAHAAKMAGKMPAGIDGVVEDFLKPPIKNWKQLLEEFLQSATKSDFTWARPSRRHVANGMYLPSYAHEKQGSIAIILDTSGSTWDARKDFASEMSHILAGLNVTAHVIHVDCAVAKYECLTREDLPLTPVFSGGGGTSFSPGFDYLEENGINVDCAIYFTDLYGRFPTHAPGYPVLWVSCTPRGHTAECPWGKTIYLEGEK